MFLENYPHQGFRMRTNIIIDDSLMEKAIKLGGMKTKKEVVEEGLKLLIRLKRQKRIRSLRGKINWEGNLDELRTA